MGKDVSREFMSTFIFLQRFDCFPAIDQMFKKMIEEDWEQVSLEINEILIVCFLRTNYMFRDNLSFYKMFLKKSEKYLRNNNIEPRKILHGLI